MTSFPVSPHQQRVLGSYFFTVGRSINILGSACWWTFHSTILMEENCTIYFMSRQRELWSGVSPGFPRDARPTQHVWETSTDQTQCHTFPAMFGAGKKSHYCCYGNTGVIVFCLSHRWVELSRHIPRKPRICPDLSKTLLDLNRFFQIQRKIKKCTNNCVRQVNHRTFYWLHKSPEKGDFLSYPFSTCPGIGTWMPFYISNNNNNNC